jgi:zinc/manganese transport system substrate-binding protein
MKRWWIAVVTLFALPAAAQLRVVATFPDLADIVKQIGGARVQVSALARPQDDFHLVTPRPSMALELSRAKLFVRVGMDLDLWADDLLTAARNAAILRGASGYVDCSVGARKLEVPTGRVDPSMGDIHIYGNPHYLFDPANAKIAARNILEGLKRVDPANTQEYQRGYEAFVARG